METKTEKTQEAIKELFDGADIESIPKHYQYPETKEFDDIVTEFFKVHNSSPFRNIEMKEVDGEPTGEVEIEMEEGFEVSINKAFSEPSKIIGDYLSAVLMVLAEAGTSTPEVESTDG